MKFSAELRSKSRGVSPVIATLLLVAITVSAGVVLYVFVNGLSARLAPSGANLVGERFAMDAYNFPSPYDSPQITIRNLGSATGVISAVYYDGSLCAQGGTGCVGATASSGSVPAQGTISLTLSVGAAQRGTTHLVKVVMADGSFFSSTIIAGQSG